MRRALRDGGDDVHGAAGDDRVRAARGVAGGYVLSAAWVTLAAAGLAMSWWFFRHGGARA